MKRPPAKRRRERGRPRQDSRDQLAIDVAAAFELVFELRPRQARLLALALVEGYEVDAGPRKIPRGRKSRPDFDHVTYQKCRPVVSFRTRDWTLRQKLKAGDIRPRRDVILRIALLLPLKPKIRDAVLQLLSK